MARRYHLSPGSRAILIGGVGKYVYRMA